MLRESILGRIYFLWLESWCFSLLQRVWRWLCRLARESFLHRLVLGETRADALFSETLLARAIRAVLRGVLALLRPLARGMEESAVCGLIRRVCAGSWLLRYETVFAVFCAVMFMVPHDDWNNSYALLAAVALLAVWLLLCAGGKRRMVWPDRMGLGFALFVLSCLVSLIFSHALRDSVRVLLFFVTAFLLCYLTFSAFDDMEKLRRLMGFLYVALVFISLVAIAQRAFHLVSVNSSYTDTRINAGVPPRVYGTLNNPANLSVFIQLFLPLSAAFAVGADRPWKRAVLGLGLLVPLLAMVMTYARAGWVSILIAAVIFLYYSERKVIPLLVILGILCIPFLPQSILIRLSTIGNSMDSSTTHRKALWEGVLLMLKDYGLTGIGLGPDTFKLLYPDYAQLGAKEGAYHTQMMYMELMLETGVLGFLSFYWMMLKQVGRLGRSLLRTEDRDLRMVLAAVLGTLAALAFSGLFEYHWFYQRCLFAFFLFLGIVFAALRIAERQNGLRSED